jgi:hypothetical protein
MYLILTTSLLNRAYSEYSEDRLARYRQAIQDSLRWIPDDVQPIIVENNGPRKTGLEEFQHAGKKVPVVYTTNNVRMYRNKGVNELMDLHEVIRQRGIKDDEVVIKLTGRYRMLSSKMVEVVRTTSASYDVWMKFMNVCHRVVDPDDCVLGCYAMRASYLKGLSASWLNRYESPERGMARYVRTAFFAKRIAEMESLDVECLFSQDGRVSIV